MSSKNITFDDEMRKNLLKGIKKVADAVSSTLGPCGRTVIIESNLLNGTPTITKDGVTVAKSITLEDPVENIGASLVKNIAAKTNAMVGDGTTSSTTLAYAIAEEGFKRISSGINPIYLRNGIDKAVKNTVEEINKIAKPITTKEEIAQVASISSNDDKEIGELIAEAIENVGRDGVITIEDSKTPDTTISYVEGMQFDRGYISAYFCNDRENMKVDFENPFILLYKGVISRADEIVPVMEIAVQKKRPLFIIAQEISGDALTVAAVNALQNNVKICAIKSPGFGDMQKEMMEDIAILTGATLMDPETGMEVKAINEAFLGSADSIKTDVNHTVIINGHGDETLIDDRVNKLRKDISNSSGYVKEKLQERLAKLSGGVAIMNIGATTEVALKEKKHRVEDALNATRAAIAEGILPGGGTALTKISDLIKNKMNDLTEEEKIGYNIVVNALNKPIIQIAENAGLSGEVVCNTCKQKKGINIGFDALKKRWVDMIEAGIVDPAKVTKSALENAASIASLVLTSSCTITNNPDDEEVNIPQM